MLLFGVISYAVVILIVAWVAQRRVKDEEDFVWLAGAWEPGWPQRPFWPPGLALELF